MFVNGCDIAAEVGNAGDVVHLPVKETPVISWGDPERDC